MLSRLIVGVMNGTVEPRLAGTVGYLSGMLLRAIEVGELENRLNQLEQTAAEMQQQREDNA